MLTLNSSLVAPHKYLIFLAEKSENSLWKLLDTFGNKINVPWKKKRIGYAYLYFPLPRTASKHHTGGGLTLRDNLTQV